MKTPYKRPVVTSGSQVGFVIVVITVIRSIRSTLRSAYMYEAHYVARKKTFTGKACWDKEVGTVFINTTTDVAATDNSIELMFPTGMESILHENRLSPFRILLFDFSEELTRQDVEKMKYLALDFIPRGRAENIENGLHLFDALERNARISPQNLDLLEELLIKIGRKDLSAKVDKFRQGKCTFPCYELV